MGGGQEATATNRDEAAMSIVKKKLSASSGISCHAWNGDRSKVALCPYNNEVHVYEVGTTGSTSLRASSRSTSSSWRGWTGPPRGT